MSAKQMLMASVVGLSMLCWRTAQADTWTDENGVVWTYKIANGVASLGGGGFNTPAIPRATTGDVVIPDTLGGCPVRTINECAFQDCKSIKSLVIPDSVTSIKQSAFAYCTSLRKLKFGNGVKKISYGTGSQIVFASTTYTLFANPFTGCSSLVGIEFGTNTLSALTISNFSAAKQLAYVYFPGKLPASVSGTMSGVAGRACYVSHEAYPDELPNPTWAGVPLKYLDGRLPTEGEWWDLAFYQPDGWPASFYLTDTTNATEVCNRFLVGDPIYCEFAFKDAWGSVDIADEINCSFYVDGKEDVDHVWWNGLKAGKWGRFVPSLLPSLQNLEPGEHTATWVLNEPRSINETDYANNTNTVTFTVVPSIDVIFVSEGNTVATRRYGIGAPYELFPSSPIRDGFRFVGWFTEEEGGNVVTATSIVPDSPTTLYAHWEIAINQTLTVGGTLSSGTTKWTFGNLYKVTSDLTVPSGAKLTIEPGVIVKFAEGKSLTVNSGGSLSAIGTHALPIVFTSIRDDANGGDTNGDGAATTPQPGDWVKIGVDGGTATFDYAKILYSSRNATTGAINMNGGTVRFSNGEIAHGAYDAVGVEGGHFFMENSVIRDCLIAFRHWVYDPIVNCVIYDCGRITQGGTGHDFRNCIFAKITETWEAFDFPSRSTYRNCCFWNEEGSILRGDGMVQDAKEACGKNGNIWANPIFVNPEKGDFRIAANSPCVDAGDGLVAPEKDYYGSPRMNVDAVRPTGTLAANGAVPDIGIYEVPGDGNIPSADLTVTAVTAPASLTVGENVEISWTVKNIGEEPTAGMWRDEIEIVAANGQTFTMGTATSQAEIKSGATANFKRTVTVPSAPEGAVQVRVTANKYQDLFEAMKSENNVGAAATTLAVPTLTVPTDGTATTVTLGGDSDYGFKVAVSAALSSQGGVLVIRGVGELDAWMGNGSIAAKDNAIRTAVKIADGTWLLPIPAGSEPRVTVRNDGEASVAAQLALEVGEFFLLDAGKISASNSGIVTVPFAGNGFDETVTCWLEKDGVRIDAADVSVESGVSAHATFDVTGSAAGDWTLHVKKGTDEASASLLTLTESRTGAKWFGDVDVPDVIRSGRAYVGTFRYGNSGDTATNAPYVRLEAKGSTLIRFSEADAWSKSIELMAASDTYPASVLKAGDSSKVTFFYKTTGSQAEIEYACTFSSVSNVPWAKLETEMRPAWASDELWGFAFTTLRANFGETWNDYLGRMRSDCDHLLKIGSPVKRMDRLMQLEVNDALGNDTALSRLASATDLARSGRGLGISFSRSYSSSLRGRFTKGILGYGWTDNFSTYAELQDSQTLVFHLPSGGSYSFTKVTGSWQPEDARDKTALTETTGAYILTYASGTAQTFAKSNMKTASIRDNQGNALTLTYSGAQLQKVQHSDGQFLTFTYTNGKLTKVMDDQGRTMTYAYTGDLLTAVTSFNGLVTSYEYLSASGKPTNRALAKIMYPDGSKKEFTYDAKGLVSTSSVNGGQLKTEIVRGDFGCYSIVAPNGGVMEVTVGANGETLKTVNARGETVKQSYTADSLLEATIAPSGKRSKISYDKDGSPIASMSASGATTAFSYTSEFDNLSSVTDAKGHALTYSYDELGRSTAVNYVDGSSSTLEYNEKGDVVRSTNRRGETIEYEYDAEGNLTKKTWPNGRTFTLAYDAKGNVTNAADSVTGAVTMEYDAKERLIRIVYPKGRGFTYTYDEFGRMTERTMLGGTPSSATATQRYAYDSLGRLASVTDGNNNPYLTNAYDPTTGWLITQTYGNGTVVSNAYDILGRTIGIYHLKPSTFQPLTYFEYAYDADGKCISQTTAEGTESYTYDADGQLTAVTYPDGTSETFTYDAVGNRITSGRAASPLAAATTVTYIVNALNQYTKIDDTTLEYDLDGNMTRKGDTHYYYDTLNRLVAVTNEAENIRWSCEYDVFGNRVAVTDNGTTTERLFVQGSLPSVAAEYNSDTLSKSHILVGAVRIADLTGTTGVSPVASSARYYHADMLGSARLLTDGTGATKGTRSFKAFGETRTSTGETTDAGYVGTLGVETDSSGLLFMRNRYYEAGMGRFVQIDPIGLDGGTVNLYEYVSNFPVIGNDPSGLWLDLEHQGWWHGLKGAVTGIGVAAAGVGLVLTAPIWGTGAAATAGTMGTIAATTGVIGGGLTWFEKGDKFDEASKHPERGITQTTSDTAEMLWAVGETVLISSLFERAKNVAASTVQQVGNRLRDIKTKRFVKDPILRIKNIERLVADALAIVDGVKDFAWYRIKCFLSCDPNEISGPLGAGEKRYVQQGEWMDYTIYFENKTNATAAAQEVFVDLPMDPNLDWSTLELGEISFGDHIDTSLVGKSHGKASYAMPGTNTFVKTEVKIKDGVLSWYMRDWDPTTADNFPASATGGFLPPNDPDTHCGEGHLSFRVRAKSDAPDGAVIRASATIVFDSNAPIETDPSWWNTVGTFHDVELEIDGVTTNLMLIAGEPFGELPTPNETRTGYTFDAWYTGENGTGTKAAPDALVPAGDFTLYANWIANKYLIAYNANGGEGVMPNQTNTYDLVSCLTSNAFTNVGHAFAGWATNETGEAVFADCAVVSNLTAEAGGEVNLYATWTVNSYTVTFDANGGEGGWSREMEYGTEISAPTVTREGYTFAGWQPALLGTVPASNVTFTAQWEIIEIVKPEPEPEPTPEPQPVVEEKPRLWSVWCLPWRRCTTGISTTPPGT